MALIGDFNNTLQKIPTFAKELKLIIISQLWSKKRISMAIELIDQLERKKNLVESMGKTIRFTPLYLIIQPEDCGLRRVTFDLTSSENAKKYIQKLLDDINEISPIFEFNVDSFYAESRYIKFFISFDIL